jgi:serine/threonine protein kinase/Tol biopolymer transport system component
MTPERWQQIREVLEKALELPPSQRSVFLDGACLSDPALRQEVESLLASSDEVRSSFLQSSSLRVTITPGTKLGDYEVKSLLGSGGMGEVYRARDSRLGRDVAIKVLPSFLSADSDRLRRFEQEARAAAALNHPNILAVFQMGTYQGAPYLVSELLEGETLREQLKRGRLAVRKAIDYGVQIARGLAAAHEKGIVHRDLKPENLFVTKDGRVKILDFGLAKLTQPQAGSDNSALTLTKGTEAGAVMGTAGYMAPEQVRGHTADHRADIFAFGAILYEMLAGKRAFQKPTSAETMTAILNEDPPAISQVTTNLPPALQRVVHRCLEKNPEQRFQSASDLAFALDALSSTSEAISRSVTAAAVLPRLRWYWLGASLFLLALAGTVLWWRSSLGVPQVTGVTQLSHDGVSKRATLLVQDGSRLYFTEGEDFGWRVVEISTAGGEVAPLATTVPRPCLQGIAPDSSGVLLTTNPFSASPLLWQPLPAGAPRRIGDLQALRASILPDGEHIIYSTTENISLANRDGSNSRVLATVSGRTGVLAVSRDGLRIRFGILEIASESRSLWELNLKDRSLHQLLQGWRSASQVRGGAWTSDGRYFVFASQTEGRWDLWALPEKGGFSGQRAEPIRLTSGPLSYGLALPSSDGKKIYAVGTARRGAMVRFDAAVKQFVPFLSGLPALDIAFSSDRKWIAYTSYPDHTVWRCRADGSDKLQITYPPLIASGRIRISPDGSQIAFSGLITGQGTAIYIADMHGSQPRVVQQAAYDPVWSLDGNALLFTSEGKDWLDSDLRTLDLRTNTVQVIADSRRRGAMGWSADGKIIAYDDTFALWTLDPQTKNWSKLYPGPCATMEMSPDSHFVYCETSDVPDHKVIRLRLSDGHSEAVMEIKDLRRVVDAEIGTVLGVAPDGSVLLTRDEGSEEIYALSVKWP